MTARILAVTGTDTGAGKTVVTAALGAALRRRGVEVSALKPVATGVTPGDAGEDARILAAAVGVEAATCALERYERPASPLAAATAAARRVDVEGLLRSIEARARQQDSGVLLVEGVGGLLVPLDEHTTVRDLLRRLGAPVLIVGRAGLGTINACALTVEAARAAGLQVCGVVLSEVDGSVEREFALENAQQIEAQCGVRMLGVLGHVADITAATALAEAAERSLDLDALLAAITGDDTLRGRILADDRAHAWHPFTQTLEWRDEDPIVVERADGCWLVDVDGRRYLDGISSLWANVHGHAHPRLDRALHEQAGRVVHSTFLGQTHAPGAHLAAELARHTPPGLKRTFFSEAGAAAVEAALRIVVLAQRYRGASQRTRLLSLEEAYHGDTAGAVSIGRSEPFHRGLDPLLFDTLRVPPPHIARLRDGVDHAAAEQRSLEALREVLESCGSTLAALIIEPRVQGAAGMLLHSDAWLREAVGLARAHGLLVVCDEVATGFGRTGDMFACGGAGVVPDVMCVGKGLSGGYLPISATLVGEELFDLFTAPYAEHRTLYYGHTYAANPLACAVARASLLLFEEEDTVARGRALAAHLASRLQDVAALDAVAEVRQRGVMIGVELRDPETGSAYQSALRMGRRVSLAARRRDVVVRPLGDVVVLNPPLVMSTSEANLLVEALTEAIAEECDANAGARRAAAAGEHERPRGHPATARG